MMGIIALVMIYTYRKREEYRQVKLDFTKIQLAPFGRRFFAGMIDLLPVIGALLYARLNVAGVETITDVVQSVVASKMVGIGIVVFLLHTTVVEAMFGRLAWQDCDASSGAEHYRQTAGSCVAAHSQCAARGRCGVVVYVDPNDPSPHP